MSTKLKGKTALAAAMKKPKMETKLVRGRDGRPATLVVGPAKKKTVLCYKGEEYPLVYAEQLEAGERDKLRREKAKAARVQRREAVLNAMSPKRRNKHGNNVSYDAEGRWDSDAEKRRWPILKAMQKDGQITGLRRQVRFPLHTYGERMVQGKVGSYVADFAYNLPDGTLVVEDVKGQRTDMFKWKAKHFKIEYGFSIVEIKA